MLKLMLFREESEKLRVRLKLPVFLLLMLLLFFVSLIYRVPTREPRKIEEKVVFLPYKHSLSTAPSSPILTFSQSMVSLVDVLCELRRVCTLPFGDGKFYYD